MALCSFVIDLDIDRELDHVVVTQTATFRWQRCKDNDDSAASSLVGKELATLAVGVTLVTRPTASIIQG